MLVGGNKLVPGTCTSLLMLMVFPKLFSLSNGLGVPHQVALCLLKTYCSDVQQNIFLLLPFPRPYTIQIKTNLYNSLRVTKYLKYSPNRKVQLYLWIFHIPDFFFLFKALAVLEYGIVKRWE
jgi:hypothetical protein